MATRQNPPAEVEQENELTTTQHILGRQEVEVDRIEEVPLVPEADGSVIIRMNTTLDSFTFGNPKTPVKLEAGKQYKVPGNIARYLDELGYVWH